MTGGYGLIEGGAVAVEGDRILWVGHMSETPEAYANLPRHDCGGHLLTPGLIDCHSHIVFGGNRAAEFEMRTPERGELRRGRPRRRGILSTVRATRAATAEALLEQTLARADLMMASGATTIEVKSGYGLTLEDELKMLRVARQIARHRPLRVQTTHLATHAVPPEYTGRAMDYIEQVAIPRRCEPPMPKGLVDAVDAFCEGIAFSPDQVERLFTEARVLGIPVKLHAEQLSDQKGTVLAARFGALSADHIEYLGTDGIAAMAASGTVAVILPGAFYTLRETQKPPIQALRDAGIPMAVATDFNPGTAPAAALLDHEHGLAPVPHDPRGGIAGHHHPCRTRPWLTDRGTIAPGQLADLCLWDATHPAQLSYTIGATPLLARMFGGQIDA